MSKNKHIGIPFHNVRSWYFKRDFHGPEHWDVLTECIRSLVNRELEYFEPADYWFEISNEQVANVISIVRTTAVPSLELSLNREDNLFCLSLSVVDFYSPEQHELAEHASDHLDTVVREILEDVYANPF
jgi:hypothetical protein